MKFSAAAVILLPLATLAAPDPQATTAVEQPISVAGDQATQLESPSTRANVVCKIVNTSGNVNCRSGPGYSYPVVAYVVSGSYYLFHCYKSGSCYNNNWCV